MFGKLLILSLFVGCILSTFDQKYIHKEIPIETFEPFTEKYDTISSRHCSQVCDNNLECQAFQFQDSVCIGSLIMTICTLFKQVKSHMIPAVLSGSLISVNWKVNYDRFLCKTAFFLHSLSKF